MTESGSHRLAIHNYALKDRQQIGWPPTDPNVEPLLPTPLKPIHFRIAHLSDPILVIQRQMGRLELRYRQLRARVGA